MSCIVCHQVVCPYVIGTLNYCQFRSQKYSITITSCAKSPQIRLRPIVVRPHLKFPFCFVFFKHLDSSYINTVLISSVFTYLFCTTTRSQNQSLGCVSILDRIFRTSLEYINTVPLKNFHVKQFYTNSGLDLSGLTWTSLVQP